MKKVKMILTNGFGPDVRVYKEAKYLVSKGFDVEILCWDRENEFAGAESDNVDGIRIKRFFPAAKYGTGYRQLKPYFQFIRECKDYLSDLDYDYLHCHDLDGIIAGWFISKKGAALVFDMHEFYEVNGPRRQRLRYLVRAVVKFFQNRSDYIIYVNEAQAKPVSRRNSKKLVFLPNYPEQKMYAGCQKIPSEKLRIAYIGAVRQFDELKNLFDACKDMSDVSISVHGAGVAYAALKEVSRQYPNVAVTGRYHYSESGRLYADTDLLYVMYPSTSEQYLVSYPVKFYEAIITKTPMIVGTNTVLGEFVMEHDIGFVVDDSNVDDIRSLIEQIRRKPDLLRNKVENLRSIQHDYSWDHVVQNLDKIYNWPLQ